MGIFHTAVSGEANPGDGRIGGEDWDAEHEDLTGPLMIATYPHYPGSSSTGQTPTASQGIVYPVAIPSPMYLRSLQVKTTSGGGNNWQWGLFDYSTNAAAATKLAGGTGALSSPTTDLTPTGAPVFIPRGAYALILLPPATGIGVVVRNTGHICGMQQASYAWDDTPDLTSGWSTTNLAFAFQLIGDLDDAGTSWP